MSNVAERLFSDFLRQPNDVVAELEQHDVVLRRRDAPALRLSQAHRDAEKAEAFLGVARVLRALVPLVPGPVERAVNEGFPWAHYLPPKERAQFIDELTQGLVAAADLESFARVSRLIHAWRATAEIHANPALAARLQAPLNTTGDEASVPKP
jgi:hypothetical protein